MTTRDTPFAAGTPCWVDLFSSDVERAKTFYGGVFGWTYVDPGPAFGGYGNFTADGRLVAGLMVNQAGSESPDVWSTYFATDDIQARVEAAAAAGATVIAAPMEVGDLGSMAVLTDPVGGLFGLWQAGAHTGFQRYNEPGSVAWNEFRSADFATSTPFYAQLFGWGLHVMSDTEAFHYVNAQVAGESVAGLMDAAGSLPAGVPSHWTVYFTVTDVDVAVDAVVALGGSVSSAAEDSPFGRIAEVADPTGVGFRLHAPLPVASAEETGEITSPTA